MRTFPYGTAALCLLCLSLLSGAWLAFHPAGKKDATLTLWVFSKEHKAAYENALPAFEKAHPGVTVRIDLVAGNALAPRLQSAFLADVDVPDLCEIEITWAGAFFRGPLEHVGFEDLTDRIKGSGLYDRMVQARFTPYTKKGRIFGLPHDVHPVMLIYNREAFERLGIDPNKMNTWDDFVREGRRVTVTTGDKPRYMIEFVENGGQSIEPLLFQRGGGYFDPNGNCIFDNEIGIQTMLWYVPLVAGPKRIGSSMTSGLVITQALMGEYFLSVIAPDWRTKGIEKDVKHMAGKMALMPLPAFTPGGRRTATWGGTMMGITKKCPKKDLAWELAQHLYLNKADLAQRFEDSNILPCLPEAWQEPGFSKPRPYWSNQPLGKLYASLAPECPAQYTSPFIQVAKDKYGEALVRCIQRYRASGDAGFEQYVRTEVKRSADEVRRLIARNPY
jgi:arabinosaccharide transport system substrate-binding protein